jgi:hypothetical protein
MREIAEILYRIFDIKVASMVFQISNKLNSLMALMPIRQPLATDGRAWPVFAERVFNDAQNDQRGVFSQSGSDENLSNEERNQETVFANFDNEPEDGNTQFNNEYFEFEHSPVQVVPTSEDWHNIESTTDVHRIATANIGDDGRPNPNPDTTPLEDIDPDPAPPPINQPETPVVPAEQGRPINSAPGLPHDTLPSPPPGDENADFGRPLGAMPDQPPDNGPVTNYTSGGPADISYNVTIEFVGNWSIQLQSAFTEAADYLSSIILSELPDAIVDGIAIDDISITATLEVIDGIGGVLGSAGPREIRDDGTFLPSTGAMTFDSADSQNQLGLGNWESIVLHEMFHALGFGTLWSLMGLTSGSVAGGDIRFTGVNAIDAYKAEFPDIAASDPDFLLGVPVETDGGPGTAGGHWDELLFDEEIMTGFVDTGSYVSEMTIAALEDMGYDTVFDNPFSATDLTSPIPADPLLDLFA